MGRSSSKVMTPRNVDIPHHVLRQNASSSITNKALVKSAVGTKNPRKRCLCLTLWLLVLVLLCGGVVLLASLLFPMQQQQQQEVTEEGFHVVFDRSNNDTTAYESRCLEEKTGIGLEQKAALSDLIVVGSLDKDGVILTQKTLKGRRRNPGGKLRYSRGSSLACHIFSEASNSGDSWVFFLSRSGHTEMVEDEGWTPRFRALVATDKLTQVIQSLVGQNDDRDKQIGTNEALLTKSGIDDLCSTLRCSHGGRCLLRDGVDPYCSCTDICPEKRNRRVTTAAAAPVCGSDHVTYRNVCELREAACGKQEDITVLQEGQCEDAANLCGEAGCPHFGVCVRGSTKRFECQCRKCESSSNSGEEPVCGSDGVEYSSQCHLQAASCHKKKEITIKHYGSCNSCLSKLCAEFEVCIEGKDGSAECICQKCDGVKADEVCGSDDITYYSPCHMRQASCIQKQDIHSRHSGSCDRCKGVSCRFNSVCKDGTCHCQSNCPESYEPVCASNGKTYFNFCYMELDNCQRQQDANFRSLQAVESHLCRKEKRQCLETTICSCPEGVGGLSCERCAPKYWAFTTFGCRKCGCNELGSESSSCNPQTGSCKCRPGFLGEKCNICLDGTLANVTKCRNQLHTGSAKHVSCGGVDCRFGATCSSRSNQCVCDMDCKSHLYYKEAVCGSDGNTYRSECQLRQYSCRLQKEVAIVAFGPCRDAPTSIYGGGEYGGRQNGVLADEKAPSATGNIGDACSNDSDCLSENAQCSEQRRCLCKDKFPFDKSTGACRASYSSTALCDPNPCHGGGSCEEHDGIFSCLCPEGFAGALCQHDLSKSSSIQVASFLGDSFVSILTPDDVVNRIEIKMNLRTFGGEEGLLLYSEGETDFISLAILDGFVEFRFNLGGSAAITLRSNSPLIRGQWHEIVAKRYHQDGLLEVDGDRVMTDSASRSSLKTLNVGSLTFLGGVDTIEMSIRAKERAGTGKGFLGCLKDLHLSRQLVSIQSDKEPLIMQRKGIVECEENPCVRLPCGENGECSVEDQGFTCKCKPDFTGRRCQKKRNECHPNPCQNQGQCKIDKDASFTCSCNEGFFGRLCEEQEDEDLWKRYRKSTGVLEKQKLSFGLQTNLTNIPLLLVQLKVNKGGDAGFLQLSATDRGRLELKILNEQKEALLTVETDNFVSDNRWHRIDFVAQNQRIRYHFDGHGDQLDGLWTNVQFSTSVHIDTTANGRLCLRHFFLRTRKNERLEKSKPFDICK